MYPIGLFPLLHPWALIPLALVFYPTPHDPYIKPAFPAWVVLHAWVPWRKKLSKTLLGTPQGDPHLSCIAWIPEEVKSLGVSTDVPVSLRRCHFQDTSLGRSQHSEHPPSHFRYISPYAEAQHKLLFTNKNLCRTLHPASGLKFSSYFYHTALQASFHLLLVECTVVFHSAGHLMKCLVLSHIWLFKPKLWPYQQVSWKWTEVDSGNSSCVLVVSSTHGRCDTAQNPGWWEQVRVFKV